MGTLTRHPLKCRARLRPDPPSLASGRGRLRGGPTACQRARAHRPAPLPTRPAGPKSVAGRNPSCFGPPPNYHFPFILCILIQQFAYKSSDFLLFTFQQANESVIWHADPLHSKLMYICVCSSLFFAFPCLFIYIYPCKLLLLPLLYAIYIQNSISILE